MSIQFINEDVAADYEAIGNVDIEIHTGGYFGRLSKLNLIGAKSMLATKSQYIKKKVVEVVTSTPPPPPTPAASLTEETVIPSPITEPAAVEPVIEHSEEEH